MHDLVENSRRPEDRRKTVLYAQFTALVSYDGSKSSIHHAKGRLEILVHDTLFHLRKDSGSPSSAIALIRLVMISRALTVLRR